MTEIAEHQILPGKPWLGGYVAGGDDATYYPELWDWFVDELGCQRVIDVGAGDGAAVDYFHERCRSVVGIEGIPQDHPLILTHDYTTGPLEDDQDPCDLIWCCEFVEHVEERFIPNFLDTFRLGRLVAMTHAAPGQIGWHHVNCRDEDYWHGVLAAAGFAFDGALTVEANRYAKANESPWNHFARSGLVFRRYE